MEIIIVAAGAFIVAALTVPAGFGLSTMLTPFVLAFMFAVEIGRNVKTY